MSQALNHKAAAWLHAYRTGALPQGRLAFGTALRQIALDDSPESLDRITALLDQVRTKIKPVFHEFARDEGCLNFAQFLAFYMGAYIAREAGTTLDWLEHDEALPLLPAGAPRKFATLLVGVAGGKLCLPLRAIRDRLFGEQPGLGCREYVEQSVRAFRAQAEPPPAEAAAPAAVAEPADELLPIRRADLPPPATRGVLGKLGALRGGRNPHWFETATQAGMLAAAGMQRIEDGTTLAPGLFKPGRKRGGLDEVSLAQGSVDAAIESGQQALLENPDNSAFLLLLHDGLVHLPGGPAAALRLECRSYRGEELHLQLALPYRPARQPGGFAIFSPRLMHCSAPSRQRPDLLGAFYAGVDRYDASGQSWNRYLDERL